MSLSTNIVNLATRVATESKSIRTMLNGNAVDLSSLNTVAKGNLVAALNELKGNLSTLSTGLADYESTNNADVASIHTDVTTINSTLVTLQNAINAIDTSAVINDATTSATQAWSSTKTNSQITAAVADVINAAPASLDTLVELAAALNNDSSFASSITALIGGKADSIHAHAVSDVTGLQAAINAKATVANVDALTLAIGDTAVNFTNTFEAGLI